MDTPTPYPQPTPTTNRPIQQFGGLLRVVDDFVTVTDHLFKRIYRNVAARKRQKITVDTDALRRAQNYARALQTRVRTQNIEIMRLTNVLAAIDEGIVMQDPNGRIILMNEAAKHLVGSVRNFWDSPLGNLFQQKAQETNPNPDLLGQLQPLGKPERIAINDSLVGVSMARAYGSQGEILGTIMILQDVTADALADRLKNSFITSMSHELLTPLTSIKGFSDLMLNLPEGKPPNRNFLEKISNNVAIMNRMVVELLDISEIGEGSFAVRQDPLNLGEQTFLVLQGLEKRLQESRLQNTVMITNPEKLNILGDARRLQWALGHLLDNAINYTPAGGEIVIQIGQIRNQHLLLKIEDSGTGISTKDLPHIFDRFYRGEARTKEGKLVDPRGLGQGLFVAKAVVEAHGGYISVASIQGEGSTFTVALPISK